MCKSENHPFPKEYLSKSKLKIGAKKYRPNEIWKMQAENKFIIK